MDTIACGMCQWTFGSTTTVVGGAVLGWICSINVQNRNDDPKKDVGVYGVSLLLALGGGFMFLLSSNLGKRIKISRTYFFRLVGATAAMLSFYLTCSTIGA